MDSRIIVEAIKNNPSSEGTKKVFLSCLKRLNTIGINDNTVPNLIVPAIEKCNYSLATKALLFRFLSKHVVPLGMLNEIKETLEVKRIIYNDNCNESKKIYHGNFDYLPIQEIKERALSKYFGTRNHEKLAVFLLLTCYPLRDECTSFKFFTSKLSISSDANVLIQLNEREWEMHLNKTKTIPHRYAPQQINLPEEVGIALSACVRTKLLNEGEVMFPTFKRQKIALCLKKDLNVECGNLNYLRHSHSRSCKSAKELVENANKAGHSVRMELFYLGTGKEGTVEEIEQTELNLS